LIAEKWLKEIQTTFQFSCVDDSHIRFNTPLTAPYGDGITLLITAHDDDRFLVSDQGYTIWNSESRGISMTRSGSARFDQLQKIVHNNYADFDPATLNIFMAGTRAVLPTMINAVLNTVLTVSDFAFSKVFLPE
jgi:hypothetical protein